MYKYFSILYLTLSILSCSISEDNNKPVESQNDDNKEAEAVNKPIIDSNNGYKVIFSENFDSTSNWTSGTTLPPENWERFRTGEEQWYPGNGHLDRRDTMEILDSNMDKSRGGSGKSLVIHRESVDKGKNYWTSDGILTKSLTEGLSEIYVEFHILFPEGFTADSPSGSSKIFRISSNDSVQKGRAHEYYLGFKSGHNGPMMIQVYGVGDYGARNFLAFRGDPYYSLEGDSLYYLTQGEMNQLPRQINRGDISLNFRDNLIGMGKNGSTPKIPDHINGGYIATDSYQNVTHEQVYGKLGTWVKFAYYLKMNSSPGAEDGIMIQWLNDIQIFSNYGIKWHRYRPDGDIPKWNSISFGGNNYFPRFDSLDRYEEWYAIDDILISNSIPLELR